MDSMVFFQVSSWMLDASVAPQVTRFFWCCSSCDHMLRCGRGTGKCPTWPSENCRRKAGPEKSSGRKQQKIIVWIEMGASIFFCVSDLAFSAERPRTFSPVQKFWNVEKKYLQVKFENLQWEFEEISNGNRGQKKKTYHFFLRVAV